MLYIWNGLSGSRTSSSKQGGQSLYQKKGKQQRDRRSSGNYGKGKGKRGGNGKGGSTPHKFYKDKKKAYAVTLK